MLCSRWVMQAPGPSIIDELPRLIVCICPDESCAGRRSRGFDPNLIVALPSGLPATQYGDTLDQGASTCVAGLPDAGSRAAKNPMLRWIVCKCSDESCAGGDQRARVPGPVAPPDHPFKAAPTIQPGWHSIAQHQASRLVALAWPNSFSVCRARLARE